METKNNTEFEIDKMEQWLYLKELDKMYEKQAKADAYDFIADKGLFGDFLNYVNEK